MNRLLIFAGILFSWNSVFAVEDPVPQFFGTGDLPGGTYSSTVNGVSNDGMTVCGSSISSNGTEAFSWTTGAGIVPLGDLSGGPFRSVAKGLSANGSLVVGHGSYSLTGVAGARWTNGGAASALFPIGSSGLSYSTTTASDDAGRYVVGSGSVNNGGIRATRWDLVGAAKLSLGALTAQPQLAGDKITTSSDALGISGNGNIIVGMSAYSVFDVEIVDPPQVQIPIYNENGQLIGYQTYDPEPYERDVLLEYGSQGFKWASGIMVGLGDLPGGAKVSKALACSADGSVIVGSGTSANGVEGVIWTSTGIQSVGDLDGGAVDCVLKDVSANGAVAVGYATGFNGKQPVIWDANLGLRELLPILQIAGVSTAGWELTEIVGISGDANVIVGNGINPSGKTEGWVITGVQPLLLIVPPPPPARLELSSSMNMWVGAGIRMIVPAGKKYQLVGRNSSANPYQPVGPEVSAMESNSPVEYIVKAKLGDPYSAYRVLDIASGTYLTLTFSNLVEGAVFNFTSIPDRNYRVETATNGDLTTWSTVSDASSTVGNPFDTSGNTAEITHSVLLPMNTSTLPQRMFFRVNEDRAP